MKPTADSSFPSNFSAGKNTTHENKHPSIKEDTEKSSGKKTPVAPPKASKGLKRNLKNWEAFINEDDDFENDDEAGLPYDEELDLGITVTSNRQPETKKRKHA
jgi:hypothetical protein